MTRCSFSRSRRRGVASLIEVLVSLTVGAILVSMAIVLLSSMMKLDQGSRTHLADDDTLHRLAFDLRGDTHAAIAIEPRLLFGAPPLPVDQPLVLILPGDRRVTYRAEGQVLVRRVAGGGAPSGMQTYRMPRGLEAAWSLRREPNASSSFLALQLSPKSRPGLPARNDRGVTLLAALGPEANTDREGN